MVVTCGGGWFVLDIREFGQSSKRVRVVETWGCDWRNSRHRSASVMVGLADLLWGWSGWRNPVFVVRGGGVWWWRNGESVRVEFLWRLICTIPPSGEGETMFLAAKHRLGVCDCDGGGLGRQGRRT